MRGTWTAGVFGLLACTAVWAQDPAWLTPDRPYAQAGRDAWSQDDLDKARRNFEADVRVNPFDATALNNLAVVESERGDNEHAAQLLERAIQLAPDNVTIAANLSRVHDYLAAYAIQPGERPTVHARPLSSANIPPPPPELWSKVSVVPMTTPARPAPPPSAPVVHHYDRPPSAASYSAPLSDTTPAPAASAPYYNGCSGHGFTMSARQAYQCQQAQPLPLAH